MSRVIFSIRYSIIPEKRSEYLNVVKELKNLVQAEGLESYSVYEQKNKSNYFEEVYIFNSEEAFENFDDNQDERIDLLMTKLSDLIKEQTTQYTTLVEVEG
ncbi:antibiotic biosynthesis monooxygenase [Melioribacter sp. Ez-97]|jgi:L-rhamnose mutarotase|uniref:antibiotic biosynthesis monooxygenase n=1 Tax=Melioribacter sp. Ez-97 TaxID=3423434 RepID=UPI003EDA97A9